MQASPAVGRPNALSLLLALAAPVVCHAGPLFQPGSEPLPGIMAADDRPKLTVRVEFDGVGTDAERAEFIKKLKEQLQKEWGEDIKDGRDGTIVRGLEVDVQEGTPGDREIGIRITDEEPPNDKTKGMATPGDSQAVLWFKNYTNDPWFTDDNRLTGLEKSAAHELGHVACVGHRNEVRNSQVSKMSQTKRRKSAAVNQPKAPDNPTVEQIDEFTALNERMKFQKEDRIKAMRNLTEYVKNGGDSPCSSIPDEEAKPGHHDVGSYDDPDEEEPGITDYAFTPLGDWTNRDLMFLNLGADRLRDTSDDWWVLKWMGFHDFEGDGIIDTEPNATLTLFDGAVYAFGLQYTDGTIYPLASFGQLSFSSPTFNQPHQVLVYEQMTAQFDLNLDGSFEVGFRLSADVSNILIPDFGTPAYDQPKSGTGIREVPEPGGVTYWVWVLLLGLRRRRGGSRRLRRVS